jgi:hypothetical protein
LCKFPEPHLLAAEIADNLPAALEEFESVLFDLQQRGRRGMTQQLMRNRSRLERAQ